MNSWIEGKSAETPTGLLGEEVDLLIIDEAPLISRKIYENYLYPVTSSRKAPTIFIGSPFGQNWFYDKFVRNKEHNSSFHFTSLDGVSVTQEEWDNAKRTLPELSFRQSYMAEFLPDGASVFRNINEIVSDTLKDAESGHSYMMGVDLAKHEDFTVITVIDRATNQVVYFDRFQGIEYPLQKKRIEAIAERYNRARVYIDSTVVGEPIKEDLERNGVFVDDFKFSLKSKKELGEKLSIFIEQKNLWIPPEQYLIDELRSFGMKLTDSGNVVYGAPEGLHDDCVYSLALAVWGLQSQTIIPRFKTEMELRQRFTQKLKKQINFI